VPPFPDNRLRQAGISAARVAQLRAQYDAMSPPQQDTFRGIVGSRSDEVLRRTYDPGGIPTAPTTPADVVADPALLTAVQTAILTAHDTDTERETFVPARLSQTALGAAFGRPLGERFRRAAASARARNSLMLGTMATPPTITTGTASLDATLTQAFRYTTSAANAAKYRIVGGLPVANAANITAYTLNRPGATGGNTSGNISKQTYGWAVEFVTDAPKVQVRSIGTSSKYMIEVDDQPVAVAPLTHANTTGTTYALLGFGSSAVRKIRIEHYFASGFLQTDIAPTYSVWAPSYETEVRVCTVGDSIDSHVGVSGPNAWQQYAAKLLGWTDVRQVSYGGTGFINPGIGLNTFGSSARVADVVAHNPDMVIISASQNDDGSTNAAALPGVALATFQAYRTALPTAPIVVLGVDAGSSGPSAARLATENAVKTGFDSWADPNSFWVPVSTDPSGSWESGTGQVSAPTGTGNRDRFGFDASHPNDAGHLYLARRVAAAFRSLVLPNLT
jgi:lysophospholipase L1-like esterase